MALMESVFKRSKEERARLSFSAISKDTRVSVDEVEHLVMKGLSLGLVKGSIDEIDKVVSVIFLLYTLLLRSFFFFSFVFKISWVQPRILDTEQIKTIRDKLSGWTAAVHEKVLTLETEEASGLIQIEAQ